MGNKMGIEAYIDVEEDKDIQEVAELAPETYKGLVADLAISKAEQSIIDEVTGVDGGRVRVIHLPRCDIRGRCAHTARIGNPRLSNPLARRVVRVNHVPALTIRLHQRARHVPRQSGGHTVDGARHHPACGVVAEPVRGGAIGHRRRGSRVNRDRAASTHCERSLPGLVGRPPKASAQPTRNSCNSCGSTAPCERKSRLAPPEVTRG